jgi:hypothetical protein
MRLFGKFVGSKVVCLVMGCSGYCVGVGGKVVQFRDSIMSALSHDVFFPPASAQFVADDTGISIVEMLTWECCIALLFISRADSSGTARPAEI